MKYYVTYKIEQFSLGALSLGGGRHFEDVTRICKNSDEVFEVIDLVTRNGHELIRIVEGREVEFKKTFTINGLKQKKEGK